jgi:hypothetical protein
VSSVSEGIFPLDEQWQVDRRGYSSELRYQLVWLSGLLPFAQLEQIFEQIGQRPLGSTTIWEQTQLHGERLRQGHLNQQAQVSVERTRWQQQRYDRFLRRCVSLDGGMVCLVGEGWKELKVGLVSSFEPEWTGDAATVRLW